ncbi:Scr1 family TA system antitoxin-like transcriptional regulator [Streptomyces sp. NPDC050161]|uniref:helix-turn-helix domain-containing protein n=1 Tax=Streptomyces sp. NPDC050161 TaxID=3365604 RepID=UPI0037A30A88
MPLRKNPDASANVPCFYGAELRYRREAAGLTLEQLVDGSFRGVSFLSQIERGERRMPEDLARHVDRVLGADGFFQRRCADARKAGLAGHPQYYADMPEMEKNATTVEDWAPAVFPGLLQTEAYVRKLSEAVKPWEGAEAIERKVRARVKRAELWRRPDRPVYWAILHERLIRRSLLPPLEMAEQLEHIAETIRASKSFLQVVPETTVAHPLMMGMAKVLTFSDAPPLVWSEGEFSGEAIDNPELVVGYRRSYDLLRAAALPTEASLAMVEEAARRYRDEAQHD